MNSEVVKDLTTPELLGENSIREDLESCADDKLCISIACLMNAESGIPNAN